MMRFSRPVNTSRELPGEANRLPHPLGLRHHVEPIDGGSSVVWLHERGKKFDTRSLARPVRTQQGEVSRMRLAYSQLLLLRA